MNGERGWTPRASRKRRLGVDHQDGLGAWVGFAGLARTTVERLIEYGSSHCEDAEAAQPLAGTLADMQHIMGAECTHLHDAGQRMLAQVRYLERTVKQGCFLLGHCPTASPRPQLRGLR